MFRALRGTALNSNVSHLSDTHSNNEPTRLRRAHPTPHPSPPGRGKTNTPGALQTEGPHPEHKPNNDSPWGSTAPTPPRLHVRRSAARCCMAVTTHRWWPPSRGGHKPTHEQTSPAAKIESARSRAQQPGNRRSLLCTDITPRQNTAKERVKSNQSTQKIKTKNRVEKNLV